MPLQVTLTLTLFLKKYDDLGALVKEMLDVITETKLDSTFPVSQFHIDWYSKLYRLYKQKWGQCNHISQRREMNVDKTKLSRLFVELNFTKSKGLLGGMYIHPLGLINIKTWLQMYILITKMFYLFHFAGIHRVCSKKKQ